MFKKVVIADRMALFVNAIYDEPHKYTGPALMVATLAFAIQIYFDFSGYSDIAFGSAQVMGIALMKNFRHPYFAKSISEFWRRWHISLSTWFRDYLYIPLGGNRVSQPRWAVNLLITFLISGLWHGANWTFIIWGALHGFYMVLDRFSSTFWDRFDLVNRSLLFSYLKDTISALTTFLLVCFAWIFFRANTLQDSWYVINHLFSGWNQFLLQLSEIARLSGNHGWLRFNEVLFQSLGLVTPLSRSEILLTGLALILLIYVELRQEHGNFMEEISLKRLTIRLAYYAILVMTILALGTSYTGVQQAFIYFQF